MSRSTLFWLLLLLLWFILGWWLCKTYLCGGSPGPVIPPAVTKCETSLLIKDGTAFEERAKRNVRFLQSSFENLSNPSATENVLSKTANYLKANSDRLLIITGRYKQGEDYDGILPNLGIARATTTKNQLIEMGAPPNQLNAKGVLDGSTCQTVDTIDNSLLFGFEALGDNSGIIDSIGNRLKGKPITLYFETNEDKLILSNQQRQDFADLSYYLDNVPEASLEVGGHTDDRGTEAYNRRLSRRRAAFIQDYIVLKAGIKGNRMTSQGFGELNPVATNDTDEGRALNRRVEVTLK